MAVPSQEEMVKRWEEGMKSAQAKRRYADSMKNLKENPMLLAAEADEAYMDGVRKSVESGYRKKRLQEADFEAMKQAASTTGAERLASGAVKAVGKYRRRIAAVYSGYDDASRAAREARKRGASIGEIVQASVDALKRAAGKM